jgi:hypothetical protein
MKVHLEKGVDLPGKLRRKADTWTYKTLRYFASFLISPTESGRS